MTLGQLDSLPGQFSLSLLSEVRDETDYMKLGVNGKIPFDFLSRIMGGNALLLPCQVALNGITLRTKGLGDTGANGLIFVSVTFAAKMLRTIKDVQRITGFTPHVIGGFDGKASQIVDVALVANFILQGRLCPQLPMVVIDIKHDVIVGRRWFHDFDVSLDMRHRMCVFGTEGHKTLLWTETGSQSSVVETETPVREDTIMPQATTAMDRTSSDEGQCGDRTKNPCDVSLTSPDEAVHARIRELEAAQTKKPNAPTTGKTRMPTDRRRSSCPADHLRKMEDALSGFPPPVFRGTRPQETRAERDAVRAQKDADEAERKRLHGRDARGEYTLARNGIAWTKNYVDIYTVTAESLLKMAERDHADVFVTSLHELERYIHDKRDEAIEKMPYDNTALFEQALSQVPENYHHLLRTFSKAESDRLPPRRPCDHAIKLKTGALAEEAVGYDPLRKMSLEKAEAAQKYILENLDKGFLEPANTPWASPITMAKKPGGGLRFCVDYRKLNDVTEKDRYPLPLIDETMARLSGATIFTKIDVRQAFHRIRMDAASKDLTAFRTRWGAFKYKVMPFGLSNGPATFQQYINGVLMDCLDEFCCAYIDDIIIFSKTKEEHIRHVTTVLERLRAAGLQADLKKCEFHVTQTKFLGFIIGTDGVATDPEKVAAVHEWKPPGTVKGVQSFLGFCNFYRKFVPEYSRVAKPLTQLTKKGEGFRWTPECAEAFEKLKARLTSAPVLAHFKYGLPTRLETDASDGVVAGVLTQLEDGDWHPVGYFSETMNPAKMNYSIHDKELLAVIRGMAYWRAELIGLQQVDPFEVVTDHRALVYFSTKRLLNRRQAGWAEFLSEFHFTISYRPGTENAAADALSRHPDDLRSQKQRQDAYRTIRIFRREPGGEHDVPAEDVFALDVCDELDMTLLCELWGVDEAAVSDLMPIVESEYRAGDVPPCPPEWSGPELISSLLQFNREHPSLEPYREKARQGVGDYSFCDEQYIMSQGRLVVPDHDQLRTKVIEDVHSRITTAHPGRNKTKELVRQRYWWPGLDDNVRRFVANCVCRSAKYPRDKTPGLLHPLPVPMRCWQHVVVDFKKMPQDRRGFNNLLVIIDRLSKTAWCVPCTDKAGAADAARMYYEGPFRVMGLPETVVSDRGPQFVSSFMDEMCRLLGIKWELSSAGHSQSAGQVENLNQWIDQRLRLFVNHHQDNWSLAIPALDFTQACLPHESLDGLAPFQVRCGYLPRMHFDWTNQTRDFASPQERMSREQAQATARTIQGYLDKARGAIETAQGRAVRQANRHRRPADFGVGDHVFIIKKTWTTDRPSTKLEFPLTQQSYRISAVKNDSYTLKVPASWRGCNRFHANRLRRDPRDPLPGQDPPRPEGEVIEDDEEWEVERVVASRLHRRQLQYRLHWRGWDEDPEWYPARNCRHAPLLLQEYHEKYPDHAGPPLRLPQWLEAWSRGDTVDDHADDNAPRGEGTRQPPRRSARKRGTGVFALEEGDISGGNESLSSAWELAVNQGMRASGVAAIPQGHPSSG